MYLNRSKAELRRAVYDLRNALSISDNVIPLHIRYPGAQYPNDCDTEYTGPAVPPTAEQWLSQELARIVRKALRTIMNE